MGNFRTEDDYPSMGSDNYPQNNGLGYDYNNPEIGDYSGYGSIKKPGIISRILSALGSIGSGMGSGIQSGITLEKVMFALYIIAMILIIINIKTVLDVFFYSTIYILQYVIRVFVVLLLIYIFCRYVLHIK